MSGAMKLKFKVQPYQTNAVDSVVDCFVGQPMVSGINYRIDPGRKVQTSAFEEGFKNGNSQAPSPITGCSGAAVRAGR